MYDATIVGGGPAGLSAALVLGRCQRRVLLCDSGKPRNANSRGVHGFLSRDGIAPAELRRIGRDQLAAYPGVSLSETRVVDADRIEGGFDIGLGDGTRLRSRKLLLATGLEIDLPDIQGLPELYGRGVFDCPYCDGWENRCGPLAVYGHSVRGKKLALEILGWSRDVVLLTGGAAELSRADRDELDRNGITLREDPIDRLEADETGLRHIHLASGEALARKALFIIPEDRRISQLASRLGCELTERGVASTGHYEKTNVPGLYVAGDASRRVHFAIVAAAEGAMAAFAINSELLDEDRL